MQPQNLLKFGIFYFLCTLHYMYDPALDLKPSHPNKHTSKPSHPNKHTSKPSHPNKHTSKPAHPNKHTSKPSHPNMLAYLKTCELTTDIPRNILWQIFAVQILQKVGIFVF